jgi:hypothetical protein
MNARLVGLSAESVCGQGRVLFGHEGDFLFVFAGELLADFIPVAIRQAADVRPVVEQHLADDLGLLLGSEVGLQEVVQW